MLDYDQLAQEYARHRKVQPAVLRALLQSPALHPGNYILALQAAAGCNGWGSDPSAEMLARARQRGGAVQFSIGRAEQLVFLQLD